MNLLLFALRFSVMGMQEVKVQSKPKIKIANDTGWELICTKMLV